MPKKRTNIRKQTRQQRKEELKKTGYKSWLEVEVADVLEAMGAPVDYEPDRLYYTIPESLHSYRPDFKLRENVYIESKGILDLASRKKLIYFKKSNPHVTIYLLFECSTNKIKAGAKQSYADWAVKNGFEYADWRYGIPNHWITGENNKHEL